MMKVSDTSAPVRFRIDKRIHKNSYVCIRRHVCVYRDNICVCD